ncbi:MAG: hypothetical protein AB1758_19100, partial [Candidatus Eremiobacterota bacterium]
AVGPAALVASGLIVVPGAAWGLASLARSQGANERAETSERAANTFGTLLEEVRAIRNEADEVSQRNQVEALARAFDEQSAAVREEQRHVTVGGIRLKRRKP